MQHNFKDYIPNIQTLVKNTLVNESGEEVEKKPREVAISYGVGKCIFLDHPLLSRLRIAMVSVTTQRANIGLRFDAAYIFNAVESLQPVMANNRLTRLRIPNLGGGHGGVRGGVSHACM